MAAGTGAQGLEFCKGHRQGRAAQLLEQLLHGGDGIRHLGGQAHVGPMAIAQALGLLQAQAEDRFDQGQVVELAAGGPAHLGFVDPFAQVPPFAVLEEGSHPRHVEAHAPLARFPSCGGRLSQELLEAGGQARQFGFRAQGETPGVGGIQHVVAKGGGQFGQVLRGGIEGQLLFTFEAHTPELHVP